MVAWRKVSKASQARKASRIASAVGLAALLVLQGALLLLLAPAATAQDDEASTITSVAPAKGLAAGGTAVVIKGTNFVGGADAKPSVKFGTTEVTPADVQYVSTSELRVTTPARAAGIVAVTVTSAGVVAATCTACYEYVTAPDATGISPTGAPPEGGTTITITGLAFAPGATVSIGGRASPLVTVVDSTKITAVTPDHPGGVATVTVTNPDGAFDSLVNALTYRPAPTASSVAPHGGPPAGGTVLTITGTGFLSGATVKVGSNAATAVAVLSSTTIRATAPSGSAGVATLTVTNPDSQVTLAGLSYTYRNAPTVTTVAPTSGPPMGGTAITLTGTQFAGGAAVTVGGAPATQVQVVSATQITATTPAGASGPADVTVTNTDTQSGTKAAAFSYTFPPTVTAVSPSGGPPAGGTGITITGTGFVAGATVEIGGEVATSVVVHSPTVATARTPAHAVGSVSLVLRNPDTQQGTLAQAYSYRDPPTLDSIAPSSGSIYGGTPIEIEGTGFVSGATVTLDGVAASDVVVVDGTTIRATTPEHLGTGPVDVFVANPDTQGATLLSAFTFAKTAPTVTGVAPAAGPLAGGATVSITGTGFSPSPEIRFGTALATQVVRVGPQSLTATTPANPAGDVTVTVKNTDAQAGSLASAYRYQTAPVVASVSPTGGPTSGGTSVTISGAGFLDGAQVTVGGAPASAVAVVGPSTITAVTPAHALGPADIVVTNTDAQAGSLAGSFVYRDPPSLLTVDPAAGRLAGGTQVTLTGTGFLEGAAVDLGDVPAQAVVVESSTTIVATTPAHGAGSVDITITNPDTQAASAPAAYTFQAAPTVASVTPFGGPPAGGTEITIAGTGFLPGVTVSVGGVEATDVEVVSSTAIQAVAPAHAAGSVEVVVANADEQEGSLAAGYVYRAAPTVTSIQPVGGALGGDTSITITGTGFVPGAEVLLDGLSATDVTVASATTISAVTPAHGEAVVDVVVLHPEGQSGALLAAYTYRPAPAITGVSPVAGALAGGTAVTIDGSGFLAAPLVDFGGVPASAVVVVGPTQITATTPAHAAGPVSVQVTNTDAQTGSLSSAFTYQAAPFVSSVSPAAGPLEGGITVTVTGTGFREGVSVTIGGQPATEVSLVSPTSLTATLPAHEAGLVGVQVANMDSQSGTAANLFRYQPAPSVTAVTPTAGALAGGTSVTITGTGFLPGATVHFGEALASATLQSPTSITATTPAHARGPVDVVVTNSDGQDGTRDAAYHYQPAPGAFTLDPASGPSLGGSNITLTGSEFLPGATVTVDGIAAETFVTNSTSLSFITPPHSAGAADLLVVNPDGQTRAANDAYSYSASAAPSISGVAPSKGRPTGGTSVVIKGAHFAPGATVAIDGAEVPVTSMSATEIALVTPAHAAATVAVSVTNVDGQTGTRPAAFTYNPTLGPFVLDVTAGPPAGGTYVRLTGTGFVPGAFASFGGEPVPSDVLSATVLAARTPAHAVGAVDVMVTGTDGQTQVLANGFRYEPAAGPLSVSPAKGSAAGGTAVTLTGTGFEPGAAVKFGDTVATATFVDATRITATTPAHAAGAVTVTVTNPSGPSASATNGFTYLAAPAVASITPASSTTNGGTPVTLTGTGFTAGTTVKFDGVPATAAQYVSATTVTAVAPVNTAGPADVLVTTADGLTFTLAGGFSYTVASAPTLTSLSVGLGPVAGGTSVSLAGTGFAPGMTISFGDVLASSVTVQDSTHASVTTPPHGAGAVAVRIQNPDGQSAVLADAFTFTTAPIEQADPGPTEEEIQEANAAVAVTVTREGDANVVGFELPDALPAPAEGVQVFRSNSPFVLVATLPWYSEAFLEAEYRDEDEDDARPTSKYLVTIYYAEDVGMAAEDPGEIPGFDELGSGTATHGAALDEAVAREEGDPWWGSVAARAALGAILLVGAVIAGAMYFLRRARLAPAPSRPAAPPRPLATHRPQAARRAP